MTNLIDITDMTDAALDATLGQVDPFRLLTDAQYAADLSAWDSTPAGVAAAAANVAAAEASTAEQSARTYRTANPCKKCCGTGALDAYWRIRGGVCFRCGGNGVEPRA